MAKTQGKNNAGSSQAEITSNMMKGSETKITAAIISSYAYIRGHNNYGSLLQYYALQQYLKKIGIETYWVRYMFPTAEMYKSIFKKVMHSLLHGLGVRNCWNHIRTQAAFRRYMHSHCNVSIKRYDSMDKLRRDVPVADIYVTGSDQVWGGTLEPNYLTFVPNGKKKIAYAVSFGQRELTPEHEARIKAWVKNFDAVSVREYSGVEICRRLGVEAEHLLDPTLLIDETDYLSAKTPRMEKSKYAFCYFINEKSPEVLRMTDIIHYCMQRQVKLKVAGIEGAETAVPRQYLFQYSPEAWLNHYKYAECIFTNTFHGTVFCIIFKKPFCVLLQKGKSAKQNERIYSLLETLGLQDRILCFDAPIEDIMEKKIDWKHVENAKKTLREKADLFWNKSLNGIL